jgi:hypothetical protein
MAANKTASTTNDDFFCIHRQAAQGSAIPQYFKGNVLVCRVVFKPGIFCS